MKKFAFLAALLIASFVVTDIADARGCGGGSGGRQGFFARRRSNRGGCGSSSSSMSYRETHSYQMRGGGGMQMRGSSCGPGGCN